MQNGQKEEELSKIKTIRESYSKLKEMEEDIDKIRYKRNDKHVERPKFEEKKPAEPVNPAKCNLCSSPSYPKTYDVNWGGAAKYFLILLLILAAVPFLCAFIYGGFYWIVFAIGCLVSCIPLFVMLIRMIINKAREGEYRRKCLEIKRINERVKLNYEANTKKFHEGREYQRYKIRYKMWEDKKLDYEKALKECDEADKRIEEEFEKNKVKEIEKYKEDHKFDDFELEFYDMINGIIGKKYLDNLDEIESFMIDGRADSIKEAIAVLEDDRHKEELIYAQHRAYKASKAVEEALVTRKKEYEVEVEYMDYGHEHYKTVGVNANSEAEAINAAMNMVANSISAKIRW